MCGVKMCIEPRTRCMSGTKSKKNKKNKVPLCRRRDAAVHWLMSQFDSSLIGPPAGFLHIVWLNTGSNQERRTPSAKLHQRAHTESTMPHTHTHGCATLRDMWHMRKETYAHANFSFMQSRQEMRGAKHSKHKTTSADTMHAF